MPDEPLWEWADGDPVRAGQYVMLNNLVGGAIFAVALWALLTMGGLIGWVAFPTPQTSIWALLIPFALVALPLLPAYFHRRFPVVRRLGISPVGVRLVMPPQGSTYYRWGEVTRLGPDWLEVHPLIGSERYRLTANQSQRLVHFLQPH